jgi:hypothetical protein
LEDGATAYLNGSVTIDAAPNIMAALGDAFRRGPQSSVRYWLHSASIVTRTIAEV